MVADSGVQPGVQRVLTGAVSGAGSSPSEAARREMLRAVQQGVAQVRSGGHVLLRLHRHPVAVLVLAIWLIGIVGDAWTTIAMMNTGLFEEANPFAALGMGHVGTEAYVGLASLVCVGLAVLSVGRAPGTYARTLLLVTVLLGGYKAYTALSNYLLWISVT